MPRRLRRRSQRRAALEKEVLEKKVAMEIGKVFKELHAQARPRNLLEPTANVVDNVEKRLYIGGEWRDADESNRHRPVEDSPA